MLGSLCRQSEVQYNYFTVGHFSTLLYKGMSLMSGAADILYEWIYTDESYFFVFQQQFIYISKSVYINKSIFAQNVVKVNTSFLIWKAAQEDLFCNVLIFTRICTPVHKNSSDLWVCEQYCTCFLIFCVCLCYVYNKHLRFLNFHVSAEAHNLVHVPFDLSFEIFMICCACGLVEWVNIN